MTSVAKALKTFFSGFGLPAYSTDTVPDDVEVPYITYLLQEPTWDTKASLYCMVWYRSKSNTEILAKADHILAAIGIAGTKIALDGGGWLLIYPETPQVQVMVDGEMRAAYINLSINAYHMPGAFPVESSQEGDG